METILHYQFFILLGLIALTATGLGWHILELKKKVSMLFGGEGTVEGNLQRDLIRRLARIEAELEEIEPRLKLTEEIAKISVQKVGFMRFNPFNDTGGDNSFALALLDREKNGILITSLYMREGIRIYGKKVEKGRTKQQLSGEEERVLDEALNSKS